MTFNIVYWPLKGTYKKACTRKTRKQIRQYTCVLRYTYIESVFTIRVLPLVLVLILGLLLVLLISCCSSDEEEVLLRHGLPLPLLFGVSLLSDPPPDAIVVSRD